MKQSAKFMFDEDFAPGGGKPTITLVEHERRSADVEAVAHRKGFEAGQAQAEGAEHHHHQHHHQEQRAQVGDEIGAEEHHADRPAHLRLGQAGVAEAQVEPAAEHEVEQRGQPGHARGAVHRDAPRQQAEEGRHPQREADQQGSAGRHVEAADADGLTLVRGRQVEALGQHFAQARCPP